MKRILLLSLAIWGLGTGCGKKEETPAPGATAATGQPGAASATGAKPGEAAKPPVAEAKAPAFADTSELWAFAPLESTFGVVVGDGVGARAMAAFVGIRGKLEGKAFAKDFLHQLDKMKDEHVNPFDEASLKKNGLDISKGMAVFVSGSFERPGLIILPVVDRAAFRALADGKVDKIADREVDRYKDLVCVPGPRYVCAPTIEEIDAALKPHDAPIAAAVKALPAEQRGDAELYVDLAKTPAAAEGLRDLRPLGDLSKVSASFRLASNGVTMRASLRGTPSPIASMFIGNTPPAELAGNTAGAATVIRFHVDPKILGGAGLPPSLPLGDADARTDFLDQLTGDAELITAGKGVLAGVLFLKVNDSAKVAKVIDAACKLAQDAGDHAPLKNLVAKPGSCSADVDVEKLGQRLPFPLPPLKLSMSVSGSLFQLTMGDVDLAALKGTVAGASPEAKDVLTGNQTFAAWSRLTSIDVTQLPKFATDAIAKEPAFGDVLNFFNWESSVVYEAAFGVSVSATGVDAVMHMTTFGSDDAETRAAYDAAVDKLTSGDRPAYMAALADIERRFPNTLAARRAQLEREGGPLLGPAMGLMVGGALTYLFERAPVREEEPTVVPVPEPQHAPPVPGLPPAAQPK